MAESKIDSEIDAIRLEQEQADREEHLQRNGSHTPLGANGGEAMHVDGAGGGVDDFEPQLTQVSPTAAFPAGQNFCPLGRAGRDVDVPPMSPTKNANVAEAGDVIDVDAGPFDNMYKMREMLMGSMMATQKSMVTTSNRMYEMNKASRELIDGAMQRADMAITM
eukprot:6908269-Heterocapsa_arctica.AAC.1